MPLPRTWCPGCMRPNRGFGAVICPECSTVSPTAGYAALAEKRRTQTQTERPKKKSRYALGRAA